jgi:glycosyltransferase involved in cell wall biosynthesis
MPPSEPRHILLAIGRYEPDHSGASEWLRRYAAWLGRVGHRVTVACECADAPAPAGCELVTAGVARPSTNSWRRAVALQTIAANHGADVVHDTGCLLSADIFHPLMGSLICNWWRQLRAFPPAMRVRRFWHVRFWRDVRLQLRQQRRHGVLVACSRRVAADFARLGCGDSVVIPNGIAACEPDPGGARRLREALDLRDRLLVLLTPTNFHLKGVLTAIRALGALDPVSRKRFLMVITGDDRDPVFRREIEARQLANCCRLIGWVNNVDEYYAAADIFLHPTFHDAGSLSTLKALAAGCAVVTSCFDGSSDFIQDGVNGLVLRRPGSPAELAGCLKQLLDPERRQRLGAAARDLMPVIDEERQFRQLETLAVPRAATAVASLA